MEKSGSSTEGTESVGVEEELMDALVEEDTPIIKDGNERVEGPVALEEEPETPVFKIEDNRNKGEIKHVEKEAKQETPTPLHQ